MHEPDLNFFYNKIICITGGNGYIGRSLIQKLLNTPCKLIILEHKKNISLTNSDQDIQAKIFRIQGNIQSPEIWDQLLKYDVDILYHFASQTSASFANQNPLEDFNTNVLPILHLTNFLKKYPKKLKIIFPSTASLYGMGSPTEKVDESWSDDILSIYDLHKQFAETYLKYFSQDNLLKFMALRLANVYGPGQKSSQIDRGVLNLIIKKATLDEPITLYNEGKELRDYIYIDDVINAFLLAAIHLDQSPNESMILASGKSYSLKTAFECALHSVNSLKPSKSFIQNEYPEQQIPANFRNFNANISKIKKLLNWQPRVNLENGLLKTALFYLNDPTWSKN